MGKKYSAKSDGSELFVAAAPDMTDDPALARVIEEVPSRPLADSQEKEDGNAAAVRNGHHRAELCPISQDVAEEGQMGIADRASLADNRWFLSARLLVRHQIDQLLLH